MKNGFEILLTYWYGIPSMPEKRIMKIKNAGFKYLSLHWCDEYESSNGKKEEIFLHHLYLNMIIYLAT